MLKSGISRVLVSILSVVHFIYDVVWLCVVRPIWALTFAPKVVVLTSRWHQGAATFQRDNANCCVWRERFSATPKY